MSRGKPQNSISSKNEQLENLLDLLGDCPLCPNCLQRCHPLQYYCAHCGANEAINPLASYMPYVRIRFNVGMIGKLWNRALHDRSLPLLLRIFYLIIALIYIIAIFGGLTFSLITVIRTIWF